MNGFKSLRDMFYSILKFRKKKWTFLKIEEGNLAFSATKTQSTPYTRAATPRARPADGKYLAR